MTPEELAARLKAQPFAAEREALMSKILLVALRNSQRRTPVRSGTLRRSETTRMEDGGARGYLGTNISYGPFVHDGTRHMEARPFFAEGIEDSRPAIDGLLQKTGDGYFAKISR